MKHLFQRAAAIVLVLTALVSILPAGASATDSVASINPIVTSYTIKSSGGTTLTSIQRNSRVTLELNIKDTGETSGTVTEIDVTKLVDSFTADSESEITATDIKSENGKPLTYKITMTRMTYSGTGQSLRLMVGYSGSYVTIDQTISQAVEYVAPSTSEIEYTPDAIPTPLIIIGRGDIDKPIEAGQEFDLTISFQNLSSVALKSPVVTYSPSESLMLTGGASTFVIDDIGAKKTATTTVHLKALDTITSATQSLGVSLTYNYYNNLSTVQASASDTVTIPAKATTETPTATIPEPPVIITRSAISAISANQTFSLTITFANKGQTALVTPVASFSTSDALILQNDASTFVLEDIPAGGSKSVTLTFKAASEITSSTQSVSADLRFSYNNGSGLTNSSTSEHITIPANVTRQEESPTQIDSPVPNVIISDFSFGGDSVAAGEQYDLSFTFTNTGRLAVENIVVIVDGGECFTMNGSSNTFYYDSLSAGGSMEQIVPMQTLATAKTGAQTVSVSFQYEYVDGTRRASSSANINLSIPVYQPDRLQIDEPTLYDTAYVGNETTITMSYVNKGKGDMSNVEATISGDGVDILQATQYLGNFASGQSGNISFVVTPWMEGDTELLITITYEDANEQSVTREFPMTLSAVEMDWGYDDPSYWDEPIDEPEETGTGIGLWVGIAGGGIVLLLLLVLLVRRRKKKSAAKRAANTWDDWDEEEPQPTPEEQPAGTAEKGE